MARKNESYEEILNKLKEVVSNMESGELTLEDSIKKYEEGVKLCNKLYSMLNSMEGKITILNNDEEEVFKEEI